MNIAKARRRTAAGVVAAALLISACGGGDSGSTADEVPVAAEDATETLTEPDTLTEYDLVRVSPTDRRAIEAELDAAAVFHVWDGSRLTVLSGDEAIVEDYLNTLFAGDVPDGADSDAAAPGVKNNAMKSLENEWNKTKKTASDTYNGGVKGYDEWSKKNLKKVKKEYRNAEGEVVDGLNKLVKWLPTGWPKSLSPAYVRVVVRAAEKQLNSVMEDLQTEGRSLGKANAKDAEQRINKLLGNFPIEFPSLRLGAGKFPNTENYAPVPAPISVDVKNKEWASANAMNLELKIDFLGIKTYKVQFGCLGFPNGWGQAPTFTFNGGCQNQWNLMAQPDLVASAAKRVANQAGRELEGMSDQILAVLTSAAKGADNPRNIPPLLLDLPINEFLGWCCSLSFGSSKTADTPDAGKPPKKDGTKDADQPDELPGDDVMAEAFGNMAKDAALTFSIPELAGISFSLEPDLSVVAIFDNRWTSAGQMEFGLSMGFFGIFAATVKMGCVTFGTSWSETPSFTFEGGCDKSWAVEFAAAGYTSSSDRLDKRTGR